MLSLGAERSFARPLRALSAPTLPLHLPPPLSHSLHPFHANRRSAGSSLWPLASLASAATPMVARLTLAKAAISSAPPSSSPAPLSLLVTSPVTNRPDLHAVAYARHRRAAPSPRFGACLGLTSRKSGHGSTGSKPAQSTRQAAGLASQFSLGGQRRIRQPTPAPASWAVIRIARGTVLASAAGLTLRRVSLPQLTL